MTIESDSLRRKIVRTQGNRAMDKYQSLVRSIDHDYYKQVVESLNSKPDQVTKLAYTALSICGSPYHKIDFEWLETLPTIALQYLGEFCT